MKTRQFAGPVSPPCLLWLCLFAGAAAPAEPQAVPVAYRTRAAERVSFSVPKVPAGLKVQPEGGGPIEAMTLRGTPAKASAALTLQPPKDEWDFSAFSYFRLDATNTGPGLVWLEGRLDNRGAQDWTQSSCGEAFLMPGESAALGIAYPRPEKFYDGPEIFRDMSNRPSGYRSHWKSFDPSKVTGLRLVVRSSSPQVNLKDITLSLAWPYGSAKNRKLEELPYLDRFGQLRAMSWPGKLTDEAELLRRRDRELAELAKSPGPASFDKWGGWADGPKLEATGFFRTDKHGGKWWLVDPDGRLFWSHGTCGAGFNSATPCDAKHAGLFAWLPGPEDPLRAEGVAQRGNRPFVDFLTINARRTFGADWLGAARDRLHRRYRRYGLNTLGAWSDEELLAQKRTPYAAMAYLWGRKVKDTEVLDPFDEKFPQVVRESIRGLAAKRGLDPWCVGVFVENEIRWSDDLMSKVFAAGPDQPAKKPLWERLKAQYGSVEKLNAAWRTSFASWDDLLRPQDLPKTDPRTKDFDALYGFFADRYYRITREQFKSVMPDHLYLGSRIHHCPWMVSHAAAAHVDVYTINHYWPTAGLCTMPRHVDKPVMVTEFHFGAADRGVPGVALSSVHDQAQRGRAYAAYVASALMHRQVVGTHWFSWADQSAAGRPGENYQFGFVDVTDTPYPEFTEAVTNVGRRMYALRGSDEKDLPAVLKAWWSGAE